MQQRQMISSLIDRYLYPDQVIFGHLFNPSLKCAHAHEMTKSDPSLTQNDQVIIYKKQMSQAKVQSMLKMMQGNHDPLFKSGFGRSQHESHKVTHQQEEYDDGLNYEDDEQSYDDQMYLMENQYENYLDDQYDEEENPIMALGQSMGALPKIKNYARQHDFNPDFHKNAAQKKLSRYFSQQNPLNKYKKQGLAQALGLAPHSLSKLANQTMKSSKTFDQQNKRNKIQKQTKKQKSQSQEEWQTQSQQQVQPNSKK